MVPTGLRIRSIIWRKFVSGLGSRLQPRPRRVSGARALRHVLSPGRAGGRRVESSNGSSRARRKGPPGGASRHLPSLLGPAPCQSRDTRGMASTVSAGSTVLSRA
ncbi:hypothetical protein F751_0419 [Auxenochlorella protothecoides]|uniref:Uncharacterized protein n=1 Tax=Auxenochlorella protothecoides TaxID=3075 RepID=A0A087SBD1_AUXPR|nr:hypothetical protein F751_0419 [Auxenochlorella protothecoides]KFM23035.1 hypothetical protein F751_0419 [Auxenochlorella protothecoides]